MIVNATSELVWFQNQHPHSEGNLSAAEVGASSSEGLEAPCSSRAIFKSVEACESILQVTVTGSPHSWSLLPAQGAQTSAEELGTPSLRFWIPDSAEHNCTA